MWRFRILPVLSMFVVALTVGVSAYAFSNTALVSRLVGSSAYVVSPLHTYPTHFAHVAIVGDSITDGHNASSLNNIYATLLFTKLHAYDSQTAITTEKVGLTGYTAAEMQNYLEQHPSKIPQNANLLVVELGTNDYSNAPLNTFEQTYPSLLDFLQKYSPNAFFMCLSTWQPPVADSYNTIIKQDCDNLANSHLYVNIQPLYMDATNRGPAGVQTPFGMSDDFYPNDKGHAAIATTIFNAIMSFIAPTPTVMQATTQTLTFPKEPTITPCRIGTTIPSCASPTPTPTISTSPHPCMGASQSVRATPCVPTPTTVTPTTTKIPAPSITIRQCVIPNRSGIKEPCVPTVTITPIPTNITPTITTPPCVGATLAAKCRPAITPSIEQIQIVNSQTGLPIADANVNFNDGTGQTNVDGLVTANTTTDNLLSIHVNGKDIPVDQSIHSNKAYTVEVNPSDGSLVTVFSYAVSAPSSLIQTNTYYIYGIIALVGLFLVVSIVAIILQLRLSKVKEKNPFSISKDRM